ncbi:unnamed protein product [Rotaria magnacalcarata]|uniref:Uncharacterized protein n=1 Tax=Rotaria magnacalcarata TaxID=392030 RepID=A0A816SUK0_9BILA|nr:unnamed protein product [Rotaria magnacalcarata]CAF2087992.1 unnamed protein product [Rotaria magnacalcarata]CAF3926333.1 unnamed protein product [Rotaria magnacalcarata]CAF3966365.1 unnamed protein product [Rotaria magnacalcarata]
MGLVSDVGSLQILPNSIMDHSLFRELIFSSLSFDTNGGTTNCTSQVRVFDTREVVLDAAINLASVIAKKSSVATLSSKIQLNYARDHSLDDNFNIFLLPSTWNNGMMLTEDVIKGVMTSSVSSKKK